MHGQKGYRPLEGRLWCTKSVGVSLMHADSTKVGRQVYNTYLRQLTGLADRRPARGNEERDSLSNRESFSPSFRGSVGVPRLVE